MSGEMSYFNNGNYLIKWTLCLTKVQSLSGVSSGQEVLWFWIWEWYRIWHFSLDSDRTIFYIASPDPHYWRELLCLSHHGLLAPCLIR